MNRTSPSSNGPIVLVNAVPSLAAFAVVCAGLVVASLVGLRFSRRVAATAGDRAFVGIACASAAVAAGSSAMYVAYLAEHSLLTLVIGDVAMALAPALFAFGLLRRGGASLWWVIVPVGFALLCAIVTSTVPQPESGSVKVVAVGAGNLLIVAAAQCGRNRHAPGTRIILWTAGAYALFCAARVVGGVVAADSRMYAVLLSTAPTTAVGVVAVVAIGWGSVRLVRSTGHRAGAGGSTASRPEGSRVRVWIEDARLLRDGLGRDAADRLDDALLDACRRNAPAVEAGRDGVTVWAGESDVSRCVAAIRRDYAQLTGVRFDGQVGSLRFAVETD